MDGFARFIVSSILIGVWVGGIISMGLLAVINMIRN